MGNTGSVQSVQSLSHVRLFATPWTAACRASLSITNSHSLPKLGSDITPDTIVTLPWSREEAASPRFKLVGQSGPPWMTSHLFLWPSTFVCVPSLTSFTHPSSWGDCKRVYKGFGKLACLKHLRWLISSPLSKWWVLFKWCPWGHGSPLPFPMSRPQETQALLFLRQEAQVHFLGPDVFQHLKGSDVGRIKPYLYHIWHLTSGRVWDHISWSNSLKFLHLCVEHEFSPTLQKLLILRTFHNSNCKPETVMLFHILLTQVLSPRGLLPAPPLLWPLLWLLKDSQDP